MKHTKLSPDDVAIDPGNPNAMEEAEYDKLVRAIQTYGFLQPILVRESPDGLVCVDGHHRLDAAKTLQLKKIPAVVLQEGDPALERHQLVQIGMNRLRGELDLGAIAHRFADLADEIDVEDMELSGYSMYEIEELIATVSGDVDEDEILMGSAAGFEEKPPPPPKPFVLEIEFGTKEDMQACRKAIKRAAGKGVALEEGVKALCGIE